MIQLSIREYCHGCPEFEPDVDKLEIWKGYDVTYQTDIRCKYRERCIEIVNYLRKEAAKK